MSNEDDVHWPVLAARAAAEKTDERTVILDVGELFVVTGYFVITAANNPRRVRAVVEAVEQELTEAGGPKPMHLEGLGELQWVLMDYGDFVVHVFDLAARDYYDLEHLWADAPRVAWQEADT